LLNFKPDYYDLVILDLKMPKMDGFELYGKLKERNDKVKICFLTARELYYERYRKKQYSALDKNLFLKKPIDNDDLLKEASKIMEVMLTFAITQSVYFSKLL
jgi:CheY-like chemotaxis protein